mmetsp:Transcript_53279/g.97376  ORF Transcript_53279/g.97376 Transcript_53279/m.97376 type:complete len:209 (-) Transcript_53279:642-1268(-)
MQGTSTCLMTGTSMTLSTHWIWGTSTVCLDVFSGEEAAVGVRRGGLGLLRCTVFRVTFGFSTFATSSRSQGKPSSSIRAPVGTSTFRCCTLSTVCGTGTSMISSTICGTGTSTTWSTDSTVTSSRTTCLTTSTSSSTISGTGTSMNQGTVLRVTLCRTTGQSTSSTTSSTICGTGTSTKCSTDRCLTRSSTTILGTSTTSSCAKLSLA